MRTAIRRGWLNNAPQADRDALVARFEQASKACHANDTAQRDLRATPAEIRTVIEMERTNLDTEIQAMRYTWAGRLTGRDTGKGGRPRERWRVSDHANRIDANELRRSVKADGTDLRTLRSVEVRFADRPNDPGERIDLTVASDTRYRWRVWLVCPRCNQRRVHLYPVRAGVRCRTCAGFGY